MDAGRFTLVTSAIVVAEIDPAPQEVRAFFYRYTNVAEIVEIGHEAMQLQQRYIESGVVTEKSEDDAQIFFRRARAAACDKANRRGKSRTGTHSTMSHSMFDQGSQS